MNKTKATVDHDEIRRWAERRGAHPARVRGTGGRRGVGMIRLDFPGFSGAKSLQEISWDEFFEKFDESNLALVYREKLASGQQSNFNKLVGRETVDVAAHAGVKVAPSRRRARSAGAARSRVGGRVKRGAVGGRGRAAASRVGRERAVGKGRVGRTRAGAKRKGVGAVSARGRGGRTAGARTRTSGSSSKRGRAVGSRSKASRTR